jgi:hypothetical protein
MIDSRSWSNLEEFRTKMNRTPYYKNVSMEFILIDKIEEIEEDI